jgi:hypothetical protein
LGSSCTSSNITLPSVDLVSAPRSLECTFLRRQELDAALFEADRRSRGTSGVPSPIRCRCSSAGPNLAISSGSISCRKKLRHGLLSRDPSA